jgi:hypothetical protein
MRGAPPDASLPDTKIDKEDRTFKFNPLEAHGRSSCARSSRQRHYVLDARTPQDPSRAAALE